VTESIFPDVEEIFVASNNIFFTAKNVFSVAEKTVGEAPNIAFFLQKVAIATKNMRYRAKLPRIF
jgi:hypothetical protein